MSKPMTKGRIIALVIMAFCGPPGWIVLTAYWLHLTTGPPAGP